MTDNVQRFATRRQARTALGHAPLDVINSATLLHALGAVYPGARRRRAEARTALLYEVARRLAVTYVRSPQSLVRDCHRANPCRDQKARYHQLGQNAIDRVPRRLIKHGVLQTIGTLLYVRLMHTLDAPDVRA